MEWSKDCPCGDAACLHVIELAGYTLTRVVVAGDTVIATYTSKSGGPSMERVYSLTVE